MHCRKKRSPWISLKILIFLRCIIYDYPVFIVNIQLKRDVIIKSLGLPSLYVLHRYSSPIFLLTSFLAWNWKIIKYFHKIDLISLTEFLFHSLSTTCIKHRKYQIKVIVFVILQVFHYSLCLCKTTFCNVK